MFEGADSLRDALTTLGALLADRGEAFALVVVGGGALLLDERIERPTRDLDALAIDEGGQYHTARPLPAALREAVAEAAQLHGLAEDWLNPGPTDQLTLGLPEGFQARTRREVFGGLRLQIASRVDQIYLKLYAATDHAPGSKHVADLIRLEPTAAELRDAAAWVKDQDGSPEFKSFVDAVVAHVEAARG